MRRVSLVLALVVATGGIVAGSLSGSLAEGDELWPLTWLAWAPVGFIILWQRPGNGVGRALMTVGLGWGLGFGSLALSERLSGEAAAWVELVNVLLGVVPWLAIITLIVVFPSGRAETRFERWLLRATLLFGAVVLTGFAVDGRPMEGTGRPSPLAVDSLSDLAVAITGNQSFLGVILLVLAAIASLVVRWRRSNGAQRAQYQWLLLGAALFAVITAIGQFFPDDGGEEFLWLLAGYSIPVAVGIAVMRYRLFEIDRIVSRTLSYAVVVGLLAAVFFGVVTLLSGLLPTESDLAIAASTLAVAALFNPLRKRVQSWVDRRFNRSRYNAQRVMDRFAGSLQDRIGSQEVVDGWVGVVSETMQPVSVAVWVREDR